MYELPFRLTAPSAENLPPAATPSRSSWFCCSKCLVQITPGSYLFDGLPFRHGEGICVQGNNNRNGTHKDSLRFAYDFKLDVGTPILAARDGIVVAACGYYHEGGMQARFKARANYVILRHADGVYSRYYHLDHNGVLVEPGASVTVGQVIGRSGNTGYTTGPHLHFDVVDTCPLETSILRLYHDQADRIAFELPAVYLATCAAGFSAPLPSSDKCHRCPVVWASPRNALTSLLNKDEVCGSIVLVERCNDIDFIDKCLHVQEAGGAGMIVINYEDGPTLHSMAAGEDQTKAEKIKIPAIMVTRDYGLKIDGLVGTPRASACIDDTNVETIPLSRETRPARAVRGEICISDHFTYYSDKASIGGPYAARTLPVKFLRPGTAEKPRFYTPRVGRRPPKDVLWPNKKV